MKIAIIGTGISGLGAAHLLHPHHDITVYERNATPGGHSRTIEIDDGGRKVPVDTGFIVFNYRNYPLLTALFEHLDVKVEKSDMSFGASIADGWVEYGSKGMFAQKRNLLRPQFWGMVFNILRFNKQARNYLTAHEGLTLGECLDELDMGDWFRRYYLQAMGAAIWSCSVETILKFPARTFLRFFDNHGLLSVNDHPQWYTVSGGSREYVARLCAPFRDRIRLNTPVTKVETNKKGLIVHDEKGGCDEYDHVVFACHANQALAMIGSPWQAHRDVLGAFGYQPNKVVVHRDASFMPRRRKAWASWVYLSEGSRDENESVSLSYWMNNLQNLPTDTPVIVTLNPGRSPDPDKVFDEHVFSHPVFDSAAVAAQARLDAVQGLGNMWFCGAYQRYGFHEDGLLSAVNVCRKLGVEPPWIKQDGTTT